MDITVIIVSYNTESLLAEAIGRLKVAAHGLRLKIVVIDNASRDGSVALLRSKFPDCSLVVNERNIGFGRANNQALSMAEGRYVLLLNTDAFVGEDTIEKTIRYMDAHPRCGILGVKLVGRDGALQPSARYFPTPLNLFLERTGLDRIFNKVRMVDDLSWDHASVRSCDWVPGCYYLVRRQLIDQIGLFDPRYFLYYEEVDHCNAARRAGWETVCFADTTVVHLGGESAKSAGELTATGRQLEALQTESELLYFRKNHGLAALATHVVLTTVADVLHAVKRTLKAQPLRGLKAGVRHAVMIWSLLARTSCGTRPTR